MVFIKPIEVSIYQNYKKKNVGLRQMLIQILDVDW